MYLQNHIKNVVLNLKAIVEGNLASGLNISLIMLHNRCLGYSVGDFIQCMPMVYCPLLSCPSFE